jgi:hypothetical protein
MYVLKHIGAFIFLFSLCLLMPWPLTAQAAPSAAEIVNRMVQVETNAWETRQLFHYYSDERSARTNAHL